jgi:hypothetical protein
VDISTSANDIILNAPFAGKKIALASPLVDIQAGAQGFSAYASGSGVALTAGSGQAQLLAMTGAARVVSGSSTATVQGYSNANISADTGHVVLTALTAGKSVSAVADVVTLGKDGSSTVNIVGNLVVSGATTTVSSTEMTVADNLLTLNAGPAATGRYPGILMERHNADVAAHDIEVTTTALSVAASVDALVCTVVAHGAAAKGWVIAFSEGANKHSTTVVSIVGEVVTFAVKLPFLFTTATVVKFFKTTASALIYDELQQAFILGYTVSDRTATAPAISQYADLMVKNLNVQGAIVTSDVSAPGFALYEIKLKDNVTTPVNTGLRYRGAYEIIVESASQTGACASWRIMKSSAASASFVATGTSIESEDSDEKLQISWPAGQAPQLFHEVVKTGGSGVDLVYKIRYLSCF